MASRALHIAVDGRELLGRPTGVGRYLLEVLRCWTHPGPAATAHRYTVIVPADPGPVASALAPNVNWHIEPGAAAGTWWEQSRLRRAVSALQPDVLFAPAYTAPLGTKCPVVLVVHDVSFFAHPEWFTWREGLRRRWLTRASARRAARVVTDSEFSRGEIGRFLGLPTDRIVVASPTANLVEGATAAASSHTVLFVGSLFQRRHPQHMIDAIAHASRTMPDVHLILAGDNRTSPPLDPQALAAAAGVSDRVDWRQYVSEGELENLYRQARVLLFLSDYEGFGITPLEALTRGVAPIVLDTEISREVYGDSAVRVPADPHAIGDAIVRLLRDPAAHAALIAAGRARLATRTWSDTARTITRAIEGAVT